MIQIPLISLALFLVAAVTLGLAAYGFTNFKIRGAAEFSFLMIALTFYIAGFGMEILTPDRQGILFWLKVEYLGIAVIPALCLMLAIRLAGNERWLGLLPVRLFLLIPIITLALYFTNSWHHLFYRSFSEVPHQVNTYFELEIMKGPWYYVNVIYLNLALLVSVLLFARKLRVDPLERQQALILIIGSLGPWIAHLYYQTGLSNDFDVAPFGFLLTAPLFAWGVFGNHMVFLLPKARNSVYQSFSDAVLIFDNRKNLVDFNRTAVSIIKTLNRNSIGQSSADLFRDFGEITGIINDNNDQRIQVRLIVDQVRRSFIISSSGVFSRKNHRLGKILLMHEITDQVFLLDNLRESEARYRLIFENTPVGVLQYDTSGKITTCNDAFVKIIGSQREVLIGLNMFNLPDQVLKRAITESLEGRIGYYEEEYHSTTALKDTPVRGFFAPITTKDSKILGGVGIVEDFSEKYQADQQLKAREEFENILITLELDFLNSEIGEIDHTFQRGLMSLGSYCKVDRAYIFRFDFDKGTMVCSHEWCASGLPSTMKSLNTIPLDHFPEWTAKLRKSEVIHIPDLEGETGDRKNEFKILKDQGIKSVVVVPIEVGGELLGFAGFDTLRELRSWSKDEKALLQVLGQIFASVIKRKEANEELISARDKAEEASRAKSSFLANMSHEIRTPLNGILGFAELIHAEFEDAVIQRYSEIILSSGNRLLETLSQILDLSRVESGKIDLIIEKINVDKAIDDVISLFTASANNKGLFIDRQRGGAQLTLKLDDQLFRNSLANLINNSIKFTNKGGLTISTAVESSNGKPFGVIRVSDTGIGIEPEYFDSIFEDFKQVSEGIKRNYEGTGLGLSLTRKFVELSGGKIHVESEKGFGATFIMSFPDPIKE